MSDRRHIRTVQRDLDYLITLLERIGGGDRTRIEISVDGRDVVAQLMADRVTVPLTARGNTPTKAIRGLRDEIERVHEERRQRRKAGST